MLPKSNADLFMPAEEDSIVFFDLKSQSDRVQFKQLIAHENVQEIDLIEQQIEELISLRNPQSKLSQNQIKEKRQDLLNGLAPKEYGKWVYYPWLNKVVHLLDEEEFIEVRTNRNLYKITKEELNTLRSKKIGVIGLSVGQSSAVALCMERLCGEIRIADFDTLDLSNMNRIRTGVHNIGLSKVSLTARTIFEIDPYVKVKCFYDGIHENNIDVFFEHESKLDLVVEECDSLDIKLLSRIKAREKQIPVVMETSDRGMLDIERFDIEEIYPFHGKIKDISFEQIKSMSPPERLTVISQIFDLNLISNRLKISIKELGKTISGWPQLASAVMLGSSVVCISARTILLGENLKSGRYFIDVKSMISRNKHKT